MSSSNNRLNLSHRAVEDKRNSAARAAVKFIIKQARTSNPESKSDLAALCWEIFFQMTGLNLLANPNRTKRMLRRRVGIWSQYGIDKISTGGLEIAA